MPGCKIKLQTIMKNPFHTSLICVKIIKKAIFPFLRSGTAGAKKAVRILGAKEWLQHARGINERLAALSKTGADNDMIQPLKQKRSEFLNVIAQIDDHILATLLIERYINSRKWEDVASSIHYSSSYTLKILHPKALDEISKILHAHIGGLGA